MLCGSHGKKAGTDEREDEAITFGIFALRDLKPNEEVVVGWEWDDDNVIHHLPALIQSPFTFPYVLSCPCLLELTDCRHHAGSSPVTFVPLPIIILQYVTSMELEHSTTVRPWSR